MRTIELLQNPIQKYSWGSHSAIPELLGKTPTGEPQAELWMGAHVKSPSFIDFHGRRRSLIELIEEFPGEILGKATAKKYSNQLPFLFKVLAAAKPLSIQVHPNRAQAKEGFEREDQLGIPLDAENRNYRDRNHKPEVICALAPFWALCGFRPTEEIMQTLNKLILPSLEPEVTVLKEHPDHAGLRNFFSALMRKSTVGKRQIVREVLDRAKEDAEHQLEFSWMSRIQSHFPDDIGVLSPILLNLVQLSPGEAMYLPAGELHAYLEGVGIELMANSDNVLRGGLTPKHIDVSEFLKVSNFRPRAVEILSPIQLTAGERRYDTPLEEFGLAGIAVKVSSPFTSARDRSVEILICTEGTASIGTPSSQGLVHLDRGSSVLVPAAVDQYRIEGEATLYRASVPI